MTKPLADYSFLRGFNHEPPLGVDYDPAQTLRELDLARRLTLNSCRLFLRVEQWATSPSAYLDHIRHFMDEAHERGISDTPILLLAYDVPGGVNGDELGVGPG